MQLNVSCSEIMRKQCKVCQVILPEKDFQPNSRQCKKCLYAKNKDYLSEYYTNHKHVILERCKTEYQKKTEGKPKQKRGRKPYIILSGSEIKGKNDEEIDAIWDTILSLVKILKERLKE